MHRKNEVEALLGSLYFFTSADVARIQTMYALARPEAVDALIEILKEAQRKQGDYVRRMIKADPTFPDKIRKFMRSTMESIKVDYEAKEPLRIAEIEKKFE